MGVRMPLNVLIVDDSAAVRKILQRVLRQTVLPIGKVIEAGDGQQALDALKNHKVGLILSDINMPNMDGLSLLAFLKDSEWKNIPVIIISAEGGGSQAMEAVQLGARGFVRKPFTTEQVQEKIAGYWT
jgi:two-component system chemotaxis response regulator CheY